MRVVQDRAVLALMAGLVPLGPLMIGLALAGSGSWWLGGLIGALLGVILAAFLGRYSWPDKPAYFGPRTEKYENGWTQ